MEEKSLNDLVDKLKQLLTLTGMKNIVQQLIKSEFLKGAVESEFEINKIMPYNYVPDYTAIDYLSEYTFDNIKGMTEDLENELRIQLQIGFMNGEGTKKVAQRIKGLFENNINRAKTIARTEMARSHSFGKLNAYKQSGLNSKKWILMTRDDRTSDISKAINKKYGKEEQAIPLNENFKASVKVGKKVILIDQPAPPFHPNERCELMIEVDL